MGSWRVSCVGGSHRIRITVWISAKAHQQVSDKGIDGVDSPAPSYKVLPMSLVLE